VSRTSVVEVSLHFLGVMLNEEVLCAEVDNMAQVVRLLVRSDKAHEDTTGVAPTTVRRCYDFESAFNVLRHPGQPLAFTHRVRQS